jgi:Ca2+ transporting ATPase
METPWTNTPEQVLQHFGVDSSRGLTSAQAAKHAELYGKNGMADLAAEAAQSHFLL